MTDKENKIPVLDGRLGAVASFVKQGAALLDVGTDHAYLPVYLCCSGVCPYAGASDVNEGPLKTADATITAYGAQDCVKTYLSDGLDAIADVSRYDTISICGMGGELIADILSRSTYVKEAKPQLILQPMTMADKLSEYLCSEGFSIEDEKLALAAGRYYRVLSVRYDGVKRTASRLENLVGDANIARGARESLFEPFIRKLYAKYRTAYEGKKRGSGDVTDDETLLREIEELAERNGIVL